MLAIDQTICGRAIREKVAIKTGDIGAESDYHNTLHSTTKSAIAIPILLGGSKAVIGVLNVESEQQDAFDGSCQVLLESFAEKVRTLLAYAKLRSDVAQTMELRTANDLLVAIGDQASNMIHRMNTTVGAMRLRILELQEMEQASELSADEMFLPESLAALRNLAEQTLKMPEEITRLLSQQGVTVDVNEIVTAELDRFEIPDNVTLELKLDRKIPLLSLYSFDIVVQNLVQNAIDAMPNGGTLIIATKSVYNRDVPNGYIELAVRDSGTGIAVDVMPRIFELNFTTKASKGRGHGLGLWWIRNFVLRAKGDITVASSPNQGAEFVVKIPVDQSVKGAQRSGIARLRKEA
jgi:signal transduction histidine kinase